MKIEAVSIEEYLAKIPEERQEVFTQLREQVLANIPNGFNEELSYGQIGYVVPHSIYPNGYHCDPKLPLPFMNIASQKNFIALYHSGIYAANELLEWFRNEYPRYCKSKLDMGKSCIRFKKVEEIPFDLIAQLTNKMSCEEWIEIYESNIKNK